MAKTYQYHLTRELATALRRKRAELGLTAREMYEETGITPQTLRAYESGRDVGRGLRTSTLEALCEGYHIRLSRGRRLATVDEDELDTLDTLGPDPEEDELPAPDGEHEITVLDQLGDELLIMVDGRSYLAHPLFERQ